MKWEWVIELTRKKTKVEKKQKKQSDPFLQREIEKYGKPIPSREFILEFLRGEKRLLTREEIIQALGLHEEYEIDAIIRRLRAMERDGQLIRTRKGAYGLPEKMDLIKGRIVSHTDGFGFVIPDDGSGDLYLSERQMRQVFHGDRVLVRVAALSYRGRKEAIIVEVLEHNTKEIVGRYIESGGVSLVIPDNKRINHDILIPPHEGLKAKPEQIVVAEIISQPTARTAPMGRIKEIMGEHMAPGMEIEIAIRSHELPAIWPEAVIEEVEAFADKVLPEEKTNRIDLRDLAFVTIDGDDAKDFDDAVFCEKLPKNGWQLYVAIADVSHYVKPGSALDSEALKRGTSVYFPGRVVPMLPKQLSNELCSLKPRVDRLSMVCKMSITKTGKIRSFEFFPAVIRSQARLTYEKVDKLLKRTDKNLLKSYAVLLPHLEELYSLYKALHAEREARGAIDFDIPETKIIFGKDRKIAKIIPSVRNDAHRLIEECMLAANVCTANFLEAQKSPGLYRIHSGPDSEGVVQLKTFLSELGLKLSGGKKPRPLHYSQLLQSIKGRPDFPLIQTILLRSLSQAVYYPINEGHFGLAYKAYTHFTSPIRRYPDLLIHRMIKNNLLKKSFKEPSPTLAELESLALHCSLTERRADDATRDAIEWLKCEFMVDKLGKEYRGTVSGVLPFGFFVSLDDFFVEGLVHISNLCNDYYHFDHVRHQLEGEVTGTVYRLGDKVNIRVVRVSLEDRQIDFDMPELEKMTKTRKKKSSTKKKVKRK